MTNESTYALISDLVNPIYDLSWLTAREQGVMASLVRVFTDAGGSGTRKSSEYTGGTVQTITEATDMSAQTFTPAVVATLTPAQVGAQYFVTDQRIASDFNAVQRDAGVDLGQVIGTSVDTNLVGDFSSLTAGTIGTSGATIAWSKVYAMLSVLRKSKAPMPYAFVCHPYHWHVLASVAAVAATVTNAPTFQDEIMRRWFVGNAAGVDIFTDANITIDGSTDAYCAMFSRDALALDIRRALRIEPQRDASRGGGGYELNATMVYAHGVWRPKFGVQGIFNAATPS